MDAWPHGLKQKEYIPSEGPKGKYFLKPESEEHYISTALHLQPNKSYMLGAENPVSTTEAEPACLK